MWFQVLVVVRFVLLLGFVLDLISVSLKRTNGVALRSQILHGVGLLCC